ncbi:pyridoxal phosphate-dependent aminotransferase [Methanocaldococcus infernus]|uniref:Aminotransferase class I and II n=1 Tax=Methanocaldococcus infernus (strain DSM 11812 / JCM 15783 / ME) TaxID=573063 RepID=D5VR61_METIM|nr:pyridoxal phosphate-dependent aminotransferase [Methanocaldococcus infernus]ADG13064.1 aminotransferase class I and II [Methanocaldococcus infernus ME]
MRMPIIDIGAKELSYEIREIVEIAKFIEKKFNRKIIWENIGDPVAKGEEIPDWIKEIVADLVRDSKSYAYCPTKGLDETREFLANLNNKRGGVQITKEDIIFFNGLGDAIAKIYGLLRREVRVINPSPSYSTHSSAEGSHAGCPPLTYFLDPYNKWYPDVEDLEKRVKYNPNICGILIINPDNPTGAVYPKKILDEIVDIANEYNLFIICDEIYCNLVYNGCKPCFLSEVIDDVPGISLKGISKELPWPGARCGWIEVYNADKDEEFRRYINSIYKAKLIEVCSTTLPQMAIPRIMGDRRYKSYLKERNKFFEKRSNEAYKKFKDIDNIVVNKTCGSFYTTVVFEKDRGEIKIEDKEVENFINKFLKDTTLDKKFTYQLLATTGICVVPLTSFCTELNGFRMTLLERDDNIFKYTLEKLAEKIDEFLNSR